MKPARTLDAQSEAGRRKSRRVRITCLAWFEASGDAVDTDQRSDAEPAPSQRSPATKGSGLARTVDLSPGGVGLVLASPLPEDARIIVDFVLPNGLRLRARGAVAHITPEGTDHHRVGVRFDSPPVLVDSDPEKD